ncbi:hypothetical protein FLONG3_707 [Fusarium longipes]|uniref:Heterokaryon incompatibility domain-containing protein n=1 Tax=Fusarium longipes TaxID=694270 RepID=A0A395T8W8_9HYPO|nr:hypothetical protein FLONG3_707 [Fusarium longipes]
MCPLPTSSNFHGDFRGLQVLRFLDVQAHCLVEKTSLEKYIALSYVWGAASNFRLTRANRPALLIPGSLERVAQFIPNTISDAIALTKRLGCRYLWVDALCLLQNDAADLELGVNAMDLIYERAWLTVVAGCGHDVSTRLPGVKEGTRKPRQDMYQICPGVELGIITGVDSLLKKSVYETRAWTFQEQVLSRRVLYFLEDKVFYRCRAAEQAEQFTDVLSQTRQTTASLGSLLPEAVQMTDPTFDYSVMLFYYTQRALTNQNDVSRAMAGIMRRFMDVMKCQFFQGLPTAAFDQFIVFSAKRGILRRRFSFPSYSWIGWKGCVDIDFRYSLTYERTNDWLRQRTWIIWYKRSPSGAIDLVWNPDANPSFPLQDMEYTGYRTRRTFASGDHVPLLLDTRRTKPRKRVSFLAVPPYPLLQFWTVSLFYNIRDVDVFEGTAHLTDSNQEKCGRVYLDGFEETTFFDSRDPFEIILLSEAYSHGSLEDKS